MTAAGPDRLGAGSATATPAADSGGLSAGALIDAARAATGLKDFGDEPVGEALDVLCDSLNRQAQLSPAGTEALRQKFLAQLGNRLRLQDWLRRHPEILDEEIAPPLIILGLPRTGTTKLQRLLSRDPRFWWMAFWESQFPVPFPDETPEAPRPRVEQGQALVEMMTTAAPQLMAIHPMVNDEADEEFMLMEHSLLSDYCAYARVPGYMAWLAQQDERPAYALLKRMLQFLQWQKRRRGLQAERWLLKAPHHLHRIRLLLEAFPEARLVQTHRDPVESIPSICSFIHTLHSLYSDTPDAEWIGTHWSQRMRSGLAATAAARRDPAVDARFVDLDFADIVAQPMTAVARIYDHLGSAPDAGTADAMQAWLARDATDHAARAGAHRYRAEDFGLDASTLRRDFAGPAAAATGAAREQ